VLPEVLPRHPWAHPNVRQLDVGQKPDSGLYVLGVPEPQHEPRAEVRLVAGVGGDDGVHEGEEALGLVVDLDIDVEEDVCVLGPLEELDSLAEGRDLLVRRLVRDELVEDTVVLLRLDPSGPVRRSVCSIAGRSAVIPRTVQES
jgi:hypothetical protein